MTVKNECLKGLETKLNECVSSLEIADSLVSIGAPQSVIDTFLIINNL